MFRRPRPRSRLEVRSRAGAASKPFPSSATSRFSVRGPDLEREPGVRRARVARHVRDRFLEDEEELPPCLGRDVRRADPPAPRRSTRCPFPSRTSDANERIRRDHVPQVVLRGIDRPDGVAHGADEGARCLGDLGEEGVHLPARRLAARDLAQDRDAREARADVVVEVCRDPGADALEGEVARRHGRAPPRRGRPPRARTQGDESEEPRHDRGIVSPPAPPGGSDRCLVGSDFSPSGTSPRRASARPGRDVSVSAPPCALTIRSAIGQAEPRSRGLRRDEELEEVRRLRGGHARAPVRHDEPPFRARVLDAHVHLARGCAFGLDGVERVRDEVQDHLSHARRVEPRGSAARARREREADLPALRLRRQERDGVARGLVEVRGHGAQGRRARVGEEVPEETREARRLLPRGLRELGGRRPARRRGVAQLLLEELEVEAHRVREGCGSRARGPPRPRRARRGARPRCGPPRPVSSGPRAGARRRTRPRSRGARRSRPRTCGGTARGGASRRAPPGRGARRRSAGSRNRRRAPRGRTGSPPAPRSPSCATSSRARPAAWSASGPRRRGAPARAP